MSCYSDLKCAADEEEAQDIRSQMEYEARAERDADYEYYCEREDE